MELTRRVGNVLDQTGDGWVRYNEPFGQCDIGADAIELIAASLQIRAARHRGLQSSFRIDFDKLIGERTDEFNRTCRPHP